jgi:PadR family transcriptional regulator, regulatory protein PadR
MSKGKGKKQNQPARLGDLEEYVLLAILKLKEDAYGATIRELLEEVTGRPIAIGVLYTTFDRLERRGLLRSWQGEATPVRGGRAKRYFAIEAEGKLALEAVAKMRHRLAPDFALEVR